MDSLLRWSIEKSTRSEDAPAYAGPAVPREPIDPAIIDLIVGKPNSEVMKVRNLSSRPVLFTYAAEILSDGKENLAVAVDQNKSLGERVTALDNFEMVGAKTYTVPGFIMLTRASL